MKEARHKRHVLYDSSYTEGPEQANPETERPGVDQAQGQVGGPGATAKRFGVPLGDDGENLPGQSAYGGDCSLFTH